MTFSGTGTVTGIDRARVADEDSSLLAPMTAGVDVKRPEDEEDVDVGPIRRLGT